MDNEVKTWLKDIDQAIGEINSFVPDLKNFKDFQADIKTKRAIERNIEIIGEAMSRILKVDSKIKISHTRKIVDTRNRIMVTILYQRIFFGVSSSKTFLT